MLIYFLLTVFWVGWVRFWKGSKWGIRGINLTFKWLGNLVGLGWYRGGVGNIYMKSVNIGEGVLLGLWES